MTGDSPYLSRYPLITDIGYTDKTELRYFDGFAYPVPTPAFEPSAFQRFELDAPIATKRNPSKQYFAFGLSLKLPTRGDLEVSVVPGMSGNALAMNQATPRLLSKLSGPCAAPGSASQYRYMHARSLQHTGVKSWAAYDARVDALLARGIPVFWETCQRLPGSISRMTRNERRNAAHIAVLLPSQLVPASGGVSLQIRTVVSPAVAIKPSGLNRQLANARTQPGLNQSTRRSQPGQPASAAAPAVKSPAYYLSFTRSPLTVAVIGDSVAWGQGLLPQQKYSRLFARELGRPARLQIYAHSGGQTGYLDPEEALSAVRGTEQLTGRSILSEEMERKIRAAGRPNIRFAAEQLGSANDFCEEDRDYSGEIPRAHPTAQCQVAHSSQMLCLAENEGGPRIRLQCGSTEPVDPRQHPDAPPGEMARERLSGLGLQRIDVRARYDYVLLSTCLNDTGAQDVLVGGKASAQELSRLHRKVMRNCDLRRGLGDLPRFYPNAAIFVTGYHKFVSARTFRRFCYADTDLLSSEEKYRNSAVAGAATGHPAIGVTGEVGAFYQDKAERLSEATARLFGRLDDYVDDRIPAVVRLQTTRNADIRSKEASVEALNGRFDGRGRGVLIATPTGWRDREAAFAEESKVFAIACDLESFSDDMGLGEVLAQLNPEDPPIIADDRHRACTDYAIDHNRDTFDLDAEVCKRASAFHPNSGGAAKIFRAIRNAMNQARVRPAADAALPLGVQ